MNDDLTVRPATENDLPKVLELYQELDSEGTLSLDAARAVFARMGRYPDYTLFVAEKSGAVIGTFTLMVSENISHRGERSGVVEAVAVSGSVQGQGLGREMMNQGLLIARAKGCYKVALSTNKSRVRAHAFYEGLGFRQHGLSFYTEFEEAPVTGQDA